MSELFDEVDEEVRREQIKKLWDKYSIYIIALMLLVVAGVGGWRGYQYVEAEKAFAEVTTKAPYGYRLLARFRQAGEVASRDPKAAAKMFDDLAADSSIGGEQQELARIRAAGLLVDSATYADMKQRLEPDTVPTAAFRHSARELLALSAFRANDTAQARLWLDQITADAETPPSLRSRAEALQGLLPPVAKS